MPLVSVFDIFKIGIGPSSSHTVGPMLAANHFISSLDKNLLSQIEAIKVDLYGSLSLTGKGHGTDRAVICGLEGSLPDNITPESFINSLSRINNSGQIIIEENIVIKSDLTTLVKFNSESLPLHPNGLTFELILRGLSEPIRKSYYSIGGGFITDQDGNPLSFNRSFTNELPFAFNTADELLKICQLESKSVAEIMLLNEITIRTESEINTGIDQIWQIMNQSIINGCSQKGILPGGLNVKRRAAEMFIKLNATSEKNILSELDYLSCYALAVNEENAAFGRIVTAPTNGAAGVVPAVFKFYLEQLNGQANKIDDYLLTAAAIANLFKYGASLSAAEMGCQGEIGVASSMAAAALTAVRGGTVEQIENAAEIAIEHSLGLTCDPIAGLVQIPCIERNAIGAAKAVAASQLALKSDGKHIVSLDQAIAAMKKTGLDMHAKYKETSTGGLAISVAAPEC